MHRQIALYLATIALMAGCLDIGPGAGEQADLNLSNPEIQEERIWHGACASWTVPVSISKEAAAAKLPPGYEPHGPTLATLLLVVDQCGSMTRGTATLELERFLAFTCIELSTTTTTTTTVGHTDCYLLEWFTDAPPLLADLTAHGLPVHEATILSTQSTIGARIELRSVAQLLRLTSGVLEDFSDASQRNVLLIFEELRVSHRFDPLAQSSRAATLVQAEGGAAAELMPGAASVTFAAVDHGSLRLELI